MNEIEKMFENAGIEKSCYPKMLKCRHCEHYKILDEYTGRCLNEVYPPFTAKKQLSLMAFLINRKVGLSFKAEQGEITVEAISRGLAGIVNRIWQDLTEEERKQIKEILK